jgi:peptidylprolyl isomerase/peptidyl-prolyl cis-trans isomerase D
MNKMRQNTGVVLWILVFAFGGIWVLQDSGGLDTLGQPGRSNYIVSVNGEEITYEEYNETLQQYLQQYQSQTGQSATAQVEDMYRDRVYESLVNNKLREQAMDRLGIEVSRAEIVEMVLGENPDPWIRQQFSNEEGQLDRALLRSVIDNPEMRQDWIQIENFLRNKRRQQKLDRLIGTAVRVTEQDIRREYIRQNKSVTAEYAALPYAAVPDDSVEVTESDLRTFYQDHREEFERPRTYNIEYVSYSKAPTSEDTTRILNELANLRSEFAAAEDDSLFLLRQGSATQYTPEYMSRDELDEALADSVYADLTPGRIVGPVVANDRGHLLKIVDAREAADPTIRARHILIQAEGEDDDAQAEARQRAAELKAQLQQGASFAALAREHSDDPGSTRQGGDLGWIGPGSMVQAFEEAAFDAPIGEIIGPVESRFGYHLIEVRDRATREVMLADLTRDIQADVATLNTLEDDAMDLEYFASESGDFAGEAQKQGRGVQQVEVQEDMNQIPGLGVSAEIMAFLEGASTGSVSDVIELDDQFVVVHVTDIEAAGYRSFDEVRQELEPRVRTQQKKAYQVDRLSQIYNSSSFEELPQVLGTEIQTASDLTLDQPRVPGLGREPRFVGTVFGLSEGEVSGVIAGENAVFVARVTSVNEPDTGQLAASERQSIRQSLLKQRTQQVQEQWIASLRDEAAIEDNRSEFLQRQ